MTKLSPTAIVFLALTAVLVIAVCIAVPVGMTYSATNSTDTSTVHDKNITTETGRLTMNTTQNRRGRSRDLGQPDITNTGNFIGGNDEGPKR